MKRGIAPPKPSGTSAASAPMLVGVAPHNSSTPASALKALGSNNNNYSNAAPAVSLSNKSSINNNNTNYNNNNNSKAATLLPDNDKDNNSKKSLSRENVRNKNKDTDKGKGKGKDKDKEKDRDHDEVDLARVRLSDLLREEVYTTPHHWNEEMPRTVAPVAMPSPTPAIALLAPALPVELKEDSPVKDSEDSYIRENSIEGKFSGLQLTHITAVAIVNALSDQVQAIDLSQNQIEAAPDFIPVNVLGLDLSHNLLKEIRVEPKSWDSLIELNLSNNEITTLLGLEILCNIQYLNVSCNKIHAVTGLENMKELKALKIQNNQITSMKALRSLSYNKSLEELDLRENPICKPGSDKDVRISIVNLVPTIKILNQLPVKSKYGQLVKGYASMQIKKPTQSKWTQAKGKSSPKKPKKASSSESDLNAPPISDKLSTSVVEQSFELQRLASDKVNPTPSQPPPPSITNPTKFVASSDTSDDSPSPPPPPPAPVMTTAFAEQKESVTPNKSFTLNESAIPFFNNQRHDNFGYFNHSIVDLDDGSDVISLAPSNTTNPPEPPAPVREREHSSAPDYNAFQHSNNNDYYPHKLDASDFFYHHFQGLQKMESPHRDEYQYRTTSPPFDTCLKSRSRTPSPEKGKRSKKVQKVTPLMQKLPWRRPPNPVLHPKKVPREGREKTLKNVSNRSLSPTPLQRTESPPEPSPPPPIHPLDHNKTSPSPEKYRLNKRSDAIHKYYQWQQRAGAVPQYPQPAFDVLQIHGIHCNEGTEMDNASSAPSVAGTTLSGMSSLNPLAMNFQSAIAHKLAVIQEQEEVEEERKKSEMLNTSPVQIQTSSSKSSSTNWMSPLIKGRIKPPKLNNNDEHVADEVLQSIRQPTKWEKHIRSLSPPSSSQYLHEVNPMKEMLPSPTKSTLLRAKAVEDKQRQEEQQEQLKKYKFAKQSPAKQRPHQVFYQEPSKKSYSNLYEKYGANKMVAALVNQSDNDNTDNDEEADGQLVRERLGSPLKQLLHFRERIASRFSQSDLDEQSINVALEFLKNLKSGDDLLSNVGQMNDLYELLFPVSKIDEKGERIKGDYYDLVKQRAKVLKHIQDNYTVPMAMSQIQENASNHPEPSGIPILHHPAIFEQKGLMAYGEAKQDYTIKSQAKELSAAIEDIKQQQMKSLELVKAASGKSYVASAQPATGSQSTATPAVPNKAPTNDNLPTPPIATLDILHAINELRAKQMNSISMMHK